MSQYDYDLNLLRVFYEIVKRGSLSEAAKKLDLGRSSVSQKLKNLEKSLDTQLIRRSTRELDLTESGKSLFEHCSSIFKELEIAESKLTNLKYDMHGHIRLCVPTSLGEDYFNSYLIDFIKENPKVSFQIIFSNRIKNFLSSEIDLALQITTIDNIPPEYVAREITSVEWCLCATATFLKQNIAIEEPQDLLNLPFVTPTYNTTKPSLTITTEKNRLEAIPLSIKLQSESLPFLRKNVLMGLGIGLLPIYSVRKALADGSHKIHGFGSHLFVISTQNFHMTQMQRNFIDFVIRKLMRTEL